MGVELTATSTKASIIKFCAITRLSGLSHMVLHYERPELVGAGWISFERKNQNEPTTAIDNQLLVLILFFCLNS